MRDFIRRYTTFIAILACAGLAVADQPGMDQGGTPGSHTSRLAPDDFDFKQLLGDPPAAGSKEEQGELDTLLQLQKDRTDAEVKRCQDEVNVEPFAFSAVIGKWFSADKLPETAKLLKLATKQAKPIIAAAKIVWNRQRPFQVSDKIKPCVDEEKSASYPSGHAARGIIWATIISELLPPDKDSVMAFGREIGDDRALAGMHFPSDVIAGQKLGREIAQRLLADPDFKTQLAKAKKEIGQMEPAKTD